LVLEFFISERKNQWFEKLRLFEDKTLWNTVLIYW
jgi:hypothetical protein